MSALLATGCIARELNVETDPPGAEVRINGVHAGRSPLRTPFRHYGTYMIEIDHPDRATLVREEPIRPPWYARFPLCLISELLLPARIRDTRWLRYSLEAADAPDRGELLQRAASRTE
jgi:hypothetical protein